MFLSGWNVARSNILEKVCGVRDQSGIFIVLGICIGGFVCAIWCMLASI